MKTFVVDSCALSTIVNTDASAIDVIKALRLSEAVRVLLPSEVILEVIAGNNLNKVLDRHERLRDIWFTCGHSRIRFQLALTKVIADETSDKKSRRDASTLSFAAAKRSRLNYRAGMKALHEELRLSREHKVLAKYDRLAADKKARDWAKGLPQNEISDQILNYEPRLIFTEYRKLIADDINTFSTPTQLRKAYERRKPSVLVTLAHLIAFRYLLNASRDDNERIAKMRKIHLNNWIDVSIAASAARSDFFVTTDSQLSQVCKHLQSRGVVHFKTINLSEFTAIAKSS